jgi:thiamine-monophosphate kinase
MTVRRRSLHAGLLHPETGASVDEFEIIRRYFARRAGDPAVRVGIGDDGAVMTPAAGRELILVVDTLVEGVHYPKDLSAVDVGYRAVEVNLSDVAAMAGRPRWATLALTLPHVDPTWLQGFAEGLFESAQRFGVTLVGGDTTRGGQTVISIQVAGDVERDAYLTRSGARAGDLIFVTGTPGDAAAGLALVTGSAGRTSGDDAARRVLLQKFTRPVARVAFGAAIGRLASAAIDVSDGMYGDIRKLLEASGVGGRVAVESLPLSAAIRGVCGEQESERLALTGGDDYELCFTADPARKAEILAAASKMDLRVTPIGAVDDSGQLELTRSGEKVEFTDDGYRHF